MGLLSRALTEERCEKLMLASYHGDEPQLERVLARPIELRGEPHLSLVWRYKTRDITKNLPLDEALATLPGLMGPAGFRNAHLHTPGEEVQLAFSKKGKGSVRVGKVAGAADADRLARCKLDGAHGRPAGDANRSGTGPLRTLLHFPPLARGGFSFPFSGSGRRTA